MNTSISACAVVYIRCTFSYGAADWFTNCGLVITSAVIGCCVTWDIYYDPGSRIYSRFMMYWYCLTSDREIHFIEQGIAIEVSAGAGRY